MTEDITIKRINEVRGDLSQEDFAQSIKSSQPVISKILSGDQQASINVLVEIAKKYEVSVDWLLGLSSRKSLKGFSTYDNVNPTTYADIIAFLVELIKNNSIVYDAVSQEEIQDFAFNTNREHPSKDRVYIMDHFIGDVISSINPLIKTNPESIDSVLESMVKNYDIPLLEWSYSIESYYKACINYKSPLEVLNGYIKEKNKLS